MRRIICLIIVVFLTGCEKYELPSSVLQQISGVNPWKLVSYNIMITPSPNDNNPNAPDVGKFVQINVTNTSNYIGLGEWKYIQTTSDNKWVIQSDTTRLPSHRKYVIGHQWNFGNPNINRLKIFDNMANELGNCEIYENSSNSIFTSGNLLKFIEIRKDFNEGMPPYVDNGFVASPNSRGVGYATALTLTTPIINAYIKDGVRIIGRFSYSINLNFIRN